jgi:GNAT superfamily N-acetyltransferase
MATNIHNFTSKQLTSENWEDLVQLFGTHGAYGGCWCTFFRQTRKEYRENSGEKNKQFFHSIVKSGQPVGLLAYAGEEPVGWCAVSPRENYSALERSRLYKRVDDQQVWSITCFYTARDSRRKGVSNFLIQEAIRLVRKNGGKIIEAYPENPVTDSIPDGDAYTGILEVFTRLGFKIVPDRDPANPVARYYIK